jgi:hypothetical protein
MNRGDEANLPPDVAGSQRARTNTTNPCHVGPTASSLRS